MGRQQGWIALLLGLVIAALSVCLNYPFQLGLDLKGGSQLTLEVQTTDETKETISDQVEAVKAVLDQRVNSWGVTESTLQTIGKKELILELPGEQNPAEAETILGKTALLEFRAQKSGTNDLMKILKSRKAQVENYLNQNISSSGIKDAKTTDIKIDKQKLIALKSDLNLSEITGNNKEQLEQINKKINEQIVSLFEPAFLSGKDLTKAGRRQDQNLNTWEVTLLFNQEGSEKFAQLTKSIAGTDRSLGIILDGVSQSQPTVGEQYKLAGITGGSATISGNFTADEARDLEVLLRGGKLPHPVKIIQVKRIGPTLGIENIRRSLVASLSGLAIVSFFMIIYYRLPGIVAVIALSSYALFNFAVYALISVTLTLPGIAGFILSIGMAVDANVLIFERIKDELRSGNTLVRSIDNGFSQAFSSIIDGHITTLISCFALYYFGTGFVRGFAATLGIGVVISLFTALSCTRTILKFLMSYKALRRPVNFLPFAQLETSSS